MLAGNADTEVGCGTARAWVNDQTLAWLGEPSHCSL